MAYDDQDDLNKWLQSQGSPNLTPQAPAAEGGPGVWSKARAMMDRQAAMQYQPQDYSKYLGQSEAAPDRTGHDFRTILAMALDLFGNKGRGAGQLMAAGNQTFDAKEAAWKRDNGPQAMLARQMQVKQLEGADRAAFNQDRSQLGAQIGQEVQLAGAQQAQGNADRTFARQEERDMAGDVQHQLDQEQSASQFAAGQGLTREQMAQSKALQEAQMRQSAGQAAAGRAQALQFHNDAMAQHAADQEQAAKLAADRLAAVQAQRAAAAEARTAAAEPKLIREYNKDTTFPRAQAEQIDTLDAISKKYEGKDMPGVGGWDGRWGGRLIDYVGSALGNEKSLDAETVTNAKAQLADLAQRLRSGAAGPDKEKLAYEIQVGAQPGASEAQFRTAIKSARAHVRNELNTQAAGREGQARKALKAGGLDKWLDGGPPTPSFDPTAYGGVLEEEEP